MTKTSYLEDIYSGELDTEIKAFVKKKVIELIRNEDNCKSGSVLQGMEYRPDKIAAYYLGDERLGWMIDIANDFTDGIQEYWLGRILKIPLIEKIAPYLA